MTRCRRWCFTMLAGMMMAAMLVCISMRSATIVSGLGAYSLGDYNDDINESVASGPIPSTIKPPTEALQFSPQVSRQVSSEVSPQVSSEVSPQVSPDAWSEPYKYPEWFEHAWPRTATSGVQDVFVGDRPLFPPCSFDPLEFRGYPFEEPRRYIRRSKNPCWYERPHEHNSLKCAPYFYLAGVAKGGTTDLFRRIRLHPDVMQGTQKEYHWWDRDRYRHLSKDPTTGDIQIHGDGSPSYLWDVFYWPVLDGNQGCVEPRMLTGQHIRHFYPAAKIILTFRHPTPRLYSRFLSRIPRTPELRKDTSKDFHRYVVRAIHHYKKCFSTWSIRHCTYNHTVYQESTIRLMEGFYPVFMADWLRIWPKEQMLILRCEDYSKNMKAVLQRVFDFLELDELTETQWANITAVDHANVGDMYEKVGKILPETKAILDEFYEPFVRKFAQIMQDSRFLWLDTTH
ncbi:hypothetical protein BaRGS_00008383 [Batillaria attramentaria]|uniref:Sulfotransferase domain-containing protein n=1 Tax=Batillaria attramentaria TaxID=370345 RepID=A0ABD0LMJ4_9CAEN